MNTSRAILNYTIAQYRLWKRNLGNANRANDPVAVAEALRTVRLYRRDALDIMAKIRLAQVENAEYKRFNVLRIDDIVDNEPSHTDRLKTQLFEGYQKSYGAH